MQTGFVQLLQRGTEIGPEGENMSRTALVARRNRTLGHRHDAGLRPGVCMPGVREQKRTSEEPQGRGRGPQDGVAKGRI